MTEHTIAALAIIILLLGLPGTFRVRSKRNRRATRERDLSRAAREEFRADLTRPKAP